MGVDVKESKYPLDSYPLMGVAMPKLTAVQVRNAKPKDRAYKLPDGHGMHLYIEQTLLIEREDSFGAEKLLAEKCPFIVTDELPQSSQLINQYGKLYQ